MLERLLFLPIWISSVFVDQLARLMRSLARMFFGLFDSDDDLDDDTDPRTRRKSKRLKRGMRRLRPYFIWGFVLLTLVGAAGLFLFRANRGYSKRLAERYELALAAAIESGDEHEAELFRRKLSQLGVSTDAGEFRTALALAEKGDVSGAYEMMQTMASADSPGYPWAHFWQAQQLIDGKLDVPTNEALPLALRHLEQVKTRSGKLAQINYLEGVAYVKMGQVDAAVDALEQASAEVPVANALLMELRRSSGDVEKAKSDAKKIRKYLSGKKIDGEKLTDVELRWQTSAARLLGDVDAETDAVQQWYEANPEDPRARFNQAVIHLRTVNAWLDEVDDRWLVEDARIPVQQLVDAAQLMPVGDYDRVRATLGEIWQKRKSSTTVQSYYDRLMGFDDAKDAETAAADESSLPMLTGKAIEFFGTSAAMEADWQAADRLLGLATESDPEWSHAWNNRAFVVGEGFPDRLEEAVGYADRAIELEPNNAEFHETRGMLNMKLQRWESAVSDLEIAVNGLVGQNKSIHRVLSQAHRRMGNENLAQTHERASK
ncbi:tetratricopeptide repeat protein [Mariniblastus fucicola]|uniref:Tetratricopeptide repeat protein n=1 Tax=Mariniblastus fucicola TaxID=980251 RepID=A0A5B9PIG6_9BACT|nr:hypothetical protein [Mariniblastus fucicola]QEG22423.1 Tetratricopeptide repeat protein [Mariniblastus fucicola]